MGSPPERLCQVVCQRAHIRAGAAYSPKRHFRILLRGELHQVETVDVDITRFPLDLDTLPGEFVEFLAADLPGRDHGRNLRDRPDKAAHDLEQLILGKAHRLPFENRSVGIERIGCNAKNGPGHIFLWRGLNEAQQPGRPLDADDDQPGCHRIERARVTRLLDPQQRPDLGDDVVGGPAGRLVDQQEPGRDRIAHESASPMEPIMVSGVPSATKPAAL